MTFLSSIIVVEDVLRSRKLYETMMGMEIESDHGIFNVGFVGGLALYRKAFFEELIEEDVELGRQNNVVLYFEVENLVELEQEIEKHGFDFVHKIREQSWMQRTFRFYDYDNHILEVAEPMDITVHRLEQNGSSIKEIAEMTGFSESQVLQELEKYQQS